MQSDNPLEPIWQAYQVTRDCLKVAQRAINKQQPSFLGGTQCVGIPQQEATQWIVMSRDESDDCVILSLWAVFERIIIDYMQRKGQKILDESPKVFSQKFYKQLQREVEYWKIDDILDLFKGTIDPILIGHAKQIKDHRDWVAHRNINRGKVLPDFAYKILSEILSQIQQPAE
ncbi:MAG: hypothetical protein AB1611_02525 [bacterium]